MSANWSGRCRVKAKLSTEFLSPENLFGSQKSGRFVVRLRLARSSSFRLAYNGSADLRSPEKEVYFRSWDLANSQCKLLQSNIQKLVQILYFQSINNSILKTHCCAKSPDFEFQCSSEPSKTPSFHHISVNFVIEKSLFK